MATITSGSQTGKAVACGAPPLNHAQMHSAKAVSFETRTATSVAPRTSSAGHNSARKILAPSKGNAGRRLVTNNSQLVQNTNLSATSHQAPSIKPTGSSGANRIGTLSPLANSTGSAINKIA